jgi:hypothetical protein
MIKKIVFSVLWLCLVHGVSGQNASQANTSNVESDLQIDCRTMGFHYLVLENSQWTSTVRRIEVFLDEKAFSEKNLSELFGYLSDNNPEPKHLTIVVHTNWNQLPYPSDCPPYGLTNQPSKPDEYDYHQAIFYRREIQGVVKEVYEYNPTLHTSDVKTVSLKRQK